MTEDEVVWLCLMFLLLISGGATLVLWAAIWINRRNDDDDFA